MVKIVKMNRSNSYPFYAVIEEAPSGEEQKFEIVGEQKPSDGELKYIKWRQCLISFNKRNRNGRFWKAKYVRESLLHPWIAQLFQKGGVPGENGHPTAVSGKLSIERLLQIDPNNQCILLKDYQFDGDSRLFGTIETIDDGNGPGDRLRRNILQGMIPSVSIRSLVPQKKNPDGTIDVTGNGRIVCWDRVHVPSHDDAYADLSKPFKIVNATVKMSSATESVNFEMLLENTDFTKWVYDNSEACKNVLDGMNPVMESACIDKNGMFSVPTDNGHVFVNVEDRLRLKENIKYFMSNH